MPTYDYKCDACGYKFECFQSIKARPVRKCPSCGKLKARRLLGIGAGIIFKGSGFYQTDYRSSDYKEAAKKDKGESTSSEGKTSEAKTPATKEKMSSDSAPSEENS